MRLLHLHSSADLYGSDRSLLRTVQAGVAHGYSSVVVLPHRGPLVEELESAGAHVLIRPIAVLRRKDLGILRLPWFLMRMLVGEALLLPLVWRADVVHINTSAVVNGSVACILTGRPLVQHVREILNSPEWLARMHARWTSLGASRIIAVSEETRRNLVVVGVEQSRIRVLHNGIDTERFKPGPEDRVKARRDLQVPTPNGTIVVVCVGRLHPWKGQDWLVEAIGRLSSAQRLPKNSVIFLVGGVVPGNEQVEKNLRSRVKALGLEKTVCFRGEMSDIRPILWAADIAVVPSTKPDPLPTTVLEAMSAALPVVASAAGGALEMVVDQSTGLLVDMGSVEQLADALELLMDDSDLRRRMGDAGQARAQTCFALKQYSEEWLGLIETAGERRTG